MCDGQRTITITLTEAQYDVFQAATQQATQDWKTHGNARRKRDIHTLKRALQKLDQAWQTGIRK